MYHRVDAVHQLRVGAQARSAVGQHLTPIRREELRLLRFAQAGDRLGGFARVRGGGAWAQVARTLLDSSPTRRIIIEQSLSSSRRLIVRT